MFKKDWLRRRKDKNDGWNKGNIVSDDVFIKKYFRSWKEKNYGID